MTDRSELKGYIWKRLCADAKHAIELAENEGAIKHPGHKGRLREILIGNLFRPWLPPSVAIGTGTVFNPMSGKRVTSLGVV